MLNDFLVVFLYLRQRSSGGNATRLSLCVSVCYQDGYLKKLLTDLNQILWNDRSTAKRAKDQRIRFWD